MKKKLLCLLVILLCCSTVTGFSSIKLEEEETDGIEYEYDELGRIIKEIYPDGSEVLYQYDRNGNLQSVVTSASKEVEANPGLLQENDIAEGRLSGPEALEDESMLRGYVHTAGDGNDREQPFMENGRTDWNKTKNKEVLSGYVNKGMEEHDIAPGVTTPWNAGWVIILLILVLAGGAIWKIRKKKLETDYKSER
ncbi:MAG: RHS repeat protein [Bacteroides sp.]|nr:RHS repeat protein [Bacteroides sp.]MCM1549953.1 RHS repeat protein [Clostridium sp.]